MKDEFKKKEKEWKRERDGWREMEREWEEERGRVSSSGP